MKTSTHSSHKKSLLVLVFIIIAIGISLRAIHIDADTPNGLSWSAGLYVDEGYKTLSPRNLVLFGKTHWHPADTYAGWMPYSPVTQWPIYAAFKTFGANISSARLSPIAFFSLLTLLFVYFTGRRYDTKLYIAGVILFVSDMSLFTYSRVALFEIPLAFFLYSLIIPLSLFNQARQSSIYPTIWLIAGGIAISALVKSSALVYVGPALIAVFALYMSHKAHLSRRQTILLLAAFTTAVVGLLTMTYGTWGDRLGVSPLAYLYKIIENPLRIASPGILIAGTLCAAHIIAFQSKTYLTNVYRISLLSMVVAAPFILSLFPYSPPRYYIPFVPAYILLILEWLYTTRDNESSESPHIIRSLFALFLVGLTITYAFTALNLHEYIQMRMIMIISALLALIFWLFRGRLSTKIVRITIIGFVAVNIVSSVFRIGAFLVNPTYDNMAMRNNLRQLVKDHEVIAGGWAPFLALGTPIRALYSSPQFNPPSTLKIIKPNYFVLSETPNAIKAFDDIKNDEGICPGHPLELGVYNNTRVALYPLAYTPPCN